MRQTFLLLVLSVFFSVRVYGQYISELIKIRLIKEIINKTKKLVIDSYTLHFRFLNFLQLTAKMTTCWNNYHSVYR